MLLKSGRHAKEALRWAAFLAAYEAPLTLPHFSGPLADFVRNAPAEDLQQWDVLLVGGKGRAIDLGGSKIQRARRGVGEGDGIYTISGSKRRVAGSGDVAILMSPERKDQAIASFRALETAAHTADSRPALMPESTTVAGPVLPESAMSLTGLNWLDVKYWVMREAACPRTTPARTARNIRRAGLEISDPSGLPT